MIDSLMGGGSDGGADDANQSAASEPAAAPESVETGDAGSSVSQAEIDAMMGGAAGEDTPAAATDTPVSSAVQEISQADIDALMGGSGGDEASAPVPVAAEPDERLDTLGRPFDAAAAEMQAAMDAEKAEAEAAAAAAPPTVQVAAPPPSAPVGDPLSLQELEIPAGLDIDPNRVTMLGDVNLPVNIELGRTEMMVEDVLQLGEGSVVELDKLAGDPVDVYINSRLVARGEVLVLNDNFCVRIGEVISNDPHRVSA